MELGLRNQNAYKPSSLHLPFLHLTLDICLRGITHKMAHKQSCQTQASCFGGRSPAGTFCCLLPPQVGAGESPPPNIACTIILFPSFPWKWHHRTCDAGASPMRRLKSTPSDHVGRLSEPLPCLPHSQLVPWVWKVFLNTRPDITNEQPFCMFSEQIGKGILWLANVFHWRGKTYSKQRSNSNKLSS